MANDQHGRTVGIATLLVRAVDEILSAAPTSAQLSGRSSHDRPVVAHDGQIKPERADDQRTP